ncbi:MAG: chloride channel protein [Sphingomonadales bacterium]
MQMTNHPGMRAVTRLLGRFILNEHVILVLLSVVIGIGVAYAAIAFRGLIALIQGGYFGFITEDVFTRAGALPWWHLLLAPTVGGLVVGLLLRFAHHDEPVHGVADVIEAHALRDARMPVKAGLWSAITSAASLGAGASTGREGPVVHLGAVLAGWLAERLDLSPALARTLLGCGVASAVAASFNAPIAGAIFALEVIMGHYALHAFAPIMVASVAGTIISRIHLGNFPAFILPDYSIQSVAEFPAFALLGVTCAAVAIALMKGAFSAQGLFRRWVPQRWARPVVGGLLIGLIAIAFPHVLGVGYEATDAALKELFSFKLLVTLLILKLLATAISLGAGFGGGVFSPSIFLGAMTGGAFGMLAAGPFPELASSPGVYAIVGMGAVAGAVLGAPFSTILIIFELTGDYQITIAIMVATSIASLITHQLYDESFFLVQLKRRGLNLSGGRARNLLRCRKVHTVMSGDYEALDRDATLSDIRRLIQTLPHVNLVVVGDDQRLLGVISFAEIQEMAFETNLNPNLRAGDIAREIPILLEAGDNLETALELLDSSGETYIPVIEDQRSRKVVGVVRERDVLLAYNRAILDAGAEEHRGR